MSETVTFINPETDRSEWGPGPWDGEPDKISWTDEGTDLPCVMVRNTWMGSWCGYVAVEPGHPAHGKDYDDVDVDVHGGLTFGDSCNETGPIEHSVCHVPEPGKPGDVFWFGFDCGHAWDIQPGLADFYRRNPNILNMPHSSYKDVKFVRRECERLAAQLIKLGGAGP